MPSRANGSSRRPLSFDHSIAIFGHSSGPPVRPCVLIIIVFSATSARPTRAFCARSEDRHLMSVWPLPGSGLPRRVRPLADRIPKLRYPGVGQHTRSRLSLPDAKHSFSELVHGCERSRADRTTDRQPRRQDSGPDNHADTR